jgi:hypothetical protein
LIIALDAERALKCLKGIEEMRVGDEKKRMKNEIDRRY